MYKFVVTGDALFKAMVAKHGPLRPEFRFLPNYEDVYDIFKNRAIVAQLDQSVLEWENTHGIRCQVDIFDNYQFNNGNASERKFFVTLPTRETAILWRLTFGDYSEWHGGPDAAAVEQHLDQ